MANPTTLQQRQQEMHRPFQPLDTTEGRQGRAIAAPQEQYAGGWNVAARTTSNLDSLAGQFTRMVTSSGTKGKEEDPELNLAYDMYAQQVFELEDWFRNAPPEEREAAKKEAAARDQTMSEYLKGLADRNVQERLIAAGVPFRKQFTARENTIDKINLEGYKAIENRNNTMNNSLVQTAVTNGTAVYNDDGSVNYIETLTYNKKLIDANRKIVQNSKNPLQALGLSPENYAIAKPHEKIIIDDIIFKDQIGAYNDMLVQYLQTSLQYLKNGQMPPEKIRLEFDTLYHESERLITEGNFPNDAIKTRLLNNLKTYKDQIDATLGERQVSVSDMENNLKGIQAMIQTSALFDEGDLGQFARTATALGGTVTGQLIQNNIIKDLGTSASANIATWDDKTKKAVAARFANATAIINGFQPKYGTTEDQRAAKAAVDNFTKQTLNAQNDWNKLSFEEKNVIRNNLLDTVTNAQSAIRGERSSLATAMESYANYIDTLNNPNTLNVLKINPDLKQGYNVATTSQVAAKVISSPSGPAGVWRTTVESEYRKIYYDEESDKFISKLPTNSLYLQKGLTGIPLVSPLTTDASWEASIDNLNKVYEALENSVELKLERPMNADEKLEVRDYIINLMYASGIPETTLVLEDNPSKEKK